MIWITDKVKYYIDHVSTRLSESYHYYMTMDSLHNHHFPFYSTQTKQPKADKHPSPLFLHTSSLSYHPQCGFHTVYVTVYCPNAIVETFERQSLISKYTLQNVT